MVEPRQNEARKGNQETVNREKPAVRVQCFGSAGRTAAGGTWQAAGQLRNRAGTVIRNPPVRQPINGNRQRGDGGNCARYKR